MKSIFYIVLANFYFISFAQVPTNDDCSGAINLPSMATPTACSGTTSAVYTGAWNTVTNGTNINANPATITACVPGDAPDDVWYRVVLRGTSMGFQVTNATGFTKTRITVWTSPSGNGCGAADFESSGCDSIVGGNGNTTIDALTDGRTYYIQISGNDGAENGNFSLSVRGIRECGCVTNANFTVLPAPINGYYLPGQVLTFTFTINNYTQLNTNWLHGVVVENLGDGWVPGSLTPLTPPASCDGSGYWRWYNSITSSIPSNGSNGPGFFYNKNSPSDNNPGNNYGDNCTSHIWRFSWTLKVRDCPFTPTNSSMSLSVNTLGDGESGSWTSYNCNLDDEFTYQAYYQPFPPPTMAITPEICTSKGSISATITGGIPNFTFAWSNGVSGTTTGAAPISITNLNAGVYSLNLTDSRGCVSRNTVRVDRNVLPTTSAINQSICQGQSIIIGGQTFTTPQVNRIIVLSNANSNGCDSSITLNLSVNPDATLALTSGSNNQTRCINTAIGNIVYTIGGGATNATVTGLPTGVTGTFAAGVLTISGTPTVSSATPFNYTVTTTGSCIQRTLTGSIIVNPEATLALTSGSNNQTRCINTAIGNIVYTIGGGATNATVTGLPTGVTGTFAAGVLTISGTPTVSSATPFNYTVTTTGTCVQKTLTGSIIVNPNATLALTSGSNNQTRCINTAIGNIVYIIGGGATNATVTGLPTGITGTFTAGVLTISGTPTVSSATPYNYTVTTTGSCIQKTLTGSIIVNPEATLALTSGSNNQTRCINTAIGNIVYTIGGGATNATVTGLPTGITGTFIAGVLTISGTPTVSSATPFNYTVTTTGTCVQRTLTGIITVNPEATLVLTSGSSNQTGCINTAISNIVYTIGGGATNATVTGLPTGVTGTITAGILTISGTPTVSSATPFNYTVTTTGSCIQRTLTGSIIVNPEATLALTSGSNNQTRCINTAIGNIVYTIGGGATNATVTGLPTGVTGTFAAGVLTISGTPTVSSATPYNYTVTTTGTCVQKTLTGNITVNPDATLVLTSGSSNQTRCINTAIGNIVYTIGGGATNATVTGLPTGVTGTFTAGVLTISGTPTASSATPFNYTVTTTGTCVQKTLTGSIIVNPDATLVLTSGSTNQVLCENTAIGNIVYTIGGGATNATVTGLPTGVTGTFAAGVLTISGTPTASSATPYNYTVTTTGICVQRTLTGTITVNPEATLALTSGSNNQTRCINTAIGNIVYTIGGGATNATVTGLPTGVTGIITAGVLTISGTPSVSSIIPFNYTVTTTGTCVQRTLTGTITVNPDATLALTSGSSNQTRCINTAIGNIVYTIGGGATNATVTGLPTGVTGTFVAGVLTISGTPTVSSATPYNYTVTTTGTCVQKTLTGNITVNPNAILALTSGSNNQNLCINTPITNIVYTIGGGATNATVTGLPTGVTGIITAGVLTISGTPTVSSATPFNYTVTTTGSCIQRTLTGSIIVNPDATLALTSGSNNQNLCVSTPITNIVYTIGGGATNATVTGLPTGVTGTFVAGVLTISGTPTVSNATPFNYNVTTTGTCVQRTLTGTITVNPEATLVLTSGSNNQNLCINTPITNIVYTIGGGATNATVTGLPTGVTGIITAGVLTISGTPSVSSIIPFNYTVTTTGTCVQRTLTGTITVNPDATLALTSGSNNQTRCINTAIGNIVYTIGGGATNATVTGLPTGVTGTFAAGVLTISGTPTVSSATPYNYTVTTTGTCVQRTLTGSIIVNPEATLALTSGSSNQTGCINTAIGNIVYTIGGGATNATVTGLPTGVTGTFAAGVLTISGTPTASSATAFNYTVTTTGTCVQKTLIGNITVNPDATLVLTSGSSNQTRCINTAIGNIVYTIGGGATNATVTGLPTGVTGTITAGILTISGTPTVSSATPYNYTVTTTGTCVQKTLTGNITVNPDATSVLTSGSNNQTRCINTAIGNIVYTIGGGATNATVTGLPIGVTGTFTAGVLTISGTPTASSATPYNYTVTTTGTCVQKTLTGNIIVNPNIVPTVNVVTTNNDVCPGGAIRLTASASVASNYQWYVNSLPVGTNSSQFSSSSLNNGDAIKVVATTVIACSNPTIATSNVINAVVNKIVVEKPKVEYCNGESFQVDLDNMTITTTPNPNYIISWTNGSQVTTDSSSQYTIDNTINTNIPFLIKYGNNCTVNDVLVVKVNPLPQIDATVDLPRAKYEQTVQLDIDVLNSSIITYYNWVPASKVSDSSIANPISTITASSLFMVNVKDSYGCVNTDSVFVELINECTEDYIFVPTAFSPNNDGLNDCFQVLSPPKLSDFRMVIFDRWSEKVFETNSEKDCWNGTYKGTDALSDSYTYIISFKCYNGTNLSKKGTISIVK